MRLLGQYIVSKYTIKSLKNLKVLCCFLPLQRIGWKCRIYHQKTNFDCHFLKKRLTPISRLERCYVCVCLKIDYVGPIGAGILSYKIKQNSQTSEFLSDCQKLGVYIGMVRVHIYLYTIWTICRLHRSGKTFKLLPQPLKSVLYLEKY